MYHKINLENFKKFWNGVINSIYGVKKNIDKFIFEFRGKYLVLGSKGTKLGSVLTAQFPKVVIYMFTYILLLDSSVSYLNLNVNGYDLNIIKHIAFGLSIVFIAVYSFFNEVLYDSADDMRRTVMINTFKRLISIFFGIKRAI